MSQRVCLLVLAATIGVAVVFAAPPEAMSGLSPDLESLVSASSPGDEIAVIIGLADRLDLDQFAARTKHARRTALVSALRGRAATAEAPVRRFLADRGATRVRSLWAIGGMSARVRADAVHDLGRLPGVASVRLDGVFDLPEAAPKVAADAGWNLESIGAPNLWSRGVDGAGVVVAVVDSGVDVDHEDLGPRWRGGSNSWFDPYDEHPSPHDATGHGTQVTGLTLGGDATGSPIGVAPGARWIAGKTFNDDGQSTFSATHEIFQWLLDPDGDPGTDDAPHVVNNSWGFRDLPGECVAEYADDIQVLRTAGIAVVFSAGNGGPNTATSVSPANNTGAFAVGGSDRTDDVMSSSSRGPAACDGGVFPALVAPGDGVRTADLTFGGLVPAASTEVIGTSFAAPHLSGAMALLLSAHPQATLDQLELALRAGAEDLGPDGPDNDSGHGRLDVVKAEAELAALVGGAGNAATFTEEGAFLTAVVGQVIVAEGFEDDAVWGGARSPATAASVTGQGVEWTSNHPGNEITTGGGPARTGDWGFYSLPHGDQTVTQPFDRTTDGFVGASSEPMNAVGGWFVSTGTGAQISVILDGDESNAISFGPVGIQHTFYGVVVDGSFTTFEFRETEGTVEDPKIIFVDDVTIGLVDGVVNRPPEGVILQPTAAVSVAIDEPVFFEGAASDPDGDAVTVVWDFGDGTTSTVLAPGNHGYASVGTYTVTFTATDDRGLADPTPDSRLVTVSDPSSATPTGVVAGVANVAGAAGSDWHTDLYLHNASANAISVQLSFSPANGGPGDPINRTVAPDETVAIEDVVNALFGATGSGAVHWAVVAGDASGLLVSANTSNRVDADRRYGQQVPGVRWSDVPPAGSSIWLPALAGRYRTNLGFATDESCTRVRIRGYDKTGVQVAQRVLDVKPLTWVQLNGLFRNVFPGLIDDPDGVALGDSVHRFEVVGDNGRVTAYTSIIDNQTSDGSYMLGRVPAEGLQFSWLPGVAKISGANDSRWTSDVILMHVGGADDTTSFGFFGPGANPAGTVDTEGVFLLADESKIEEDILGTLFGYQAPKVGSLLTIAPANSGGLVWMRTYTEEAVAGGGTRTYGQAIEPRRQDVVITGAGEGRISGFSHDQTTRANLILQNTRSADGDYRTSTVRVRILGPDGGLLHQQDYALEPGEYLQHNRFVEDYGIAALHAGTAIVTLLDPPIAGETGGVDAMVSEVNGNTTQGTNDGRLIRADVKVQR
ncbi:MAG: S8 family serine peptidase [Candidatus Sulfomarinibacteraceae bacterium]